MSSVTIAEDVDVVGMWLDESMMVEESTPNSTMPRMLLLAPQQYVYSPCSIRVTDIVAHRRSYPKVLRSNGELRSVLQVLRRKFSAIPRLRKNVAYLDLQKLKILSPFLRLPSHLSY